MEQIPLVFTWLAFATVVLGGLWELKHFSRTLHTKAVRRRSPSSSIRVGVIMPSDSYTAR